MFETLLENIQNLERYVYFLAGAISVTILFLMLKWIAYKLKGLAVALKIIFFLALLAAVIAYFVAINKENLSLLTISV